MPQAHTTPKPPKPSRSNQLARFCQTGTLVFLCTPILAFNPGCGNEPKLKVTLYSASSTTQAIQEIKASFELTHPDIQLELVFAGSHTLAMQIQEGAPADIFISADRAQIDRAFGFTPPNRLFENQLVAISRTLNSPSITQAISDASTILLAHEDVPVGRYTRDALDHLNVWSIVEPKVVSYENSVSSVRTKTDMHQADLGFVYRTDAINATPPYHVIEFPKDIPTTTQTWITRREDTLADESPTYIVYEYVTQSTESKRIFSQLGFIVPENSP